MHLSHAHKHLQGHFSMFYLPFACLKHCWEKISVLVFEFVCHFIYLRLNKNLTIIPLISTFQMIVRISPFPQMFMFFGWDCVERWKQSRPRCLVYVWSQKKRKDSVSFSFSQQTIPACQNLDRNPWLCPMKRLERPLHLLSLTFFLSFLHDYLLFILCIIFEDLCQHCLFSSISKSRPLWRHICPLIASKGQTERGNS